jgi:hypothetical protein
MRMSIKFHREEHLFQVPALASQTFILKAQHDVDHKCGKKRLRRILLGEGVGLGERYPTCRYIRRVLLHKCTACNSGQI